MDCTVAAGGRPAPDSPLYAYTGGAPKSCVDIGGRPMIEWVVEALQRAHWVDDVVVVGLTAEEREGLSFPEPVDYLPDGGSLVANARAGLEWGLERRPDATEMLFCSADIPLITPEIVDRFVEGCRPFDKIAYYIFVTRATMEERFPHSKRTFVKLKGVEVAGGDLVLLQSEIMNTNNEFWYALTNARKHAWKLAGIVGLPFLLKFFLRRTTIADIEAAAGRILDRPIEVQFSQDAELAMDADKPDQIDLLRQEFETT